MSKSMFFLSLCLLPIILALPAFADQYDDCVTACNPNLAPCIEKARLSAGNIQEEQDMIAACEKIKADCIQKCKDDETRPQAPPAEQPNAQ